ncbi:MAG: hypothetical protein A2900_03505 [Candidatus Chisholmbacteria bacterium RIFCSPLOWO2_01_FULL_50_28]|uniref:Uncharacterized protein n=1 Tax=Candidatus Chisholmbacteria bacterium RIFCSPHIGHO2_01_FULL_52_32 TaxID=1797591 RepID=A0A1G1VSV9_9BACT|nr:MAG: hypothetical protein A2786_03240 [Candidatus Chisholmbacteria bacterium RIFCSPHIGHO2_01_FULL_52_32]OGY20143.1 MAG: hypothetical protein A2900_03505 [Candidatus Chisholmbacteria bacterium RIFCSPLOWO2_01_FULL_50_28]
MNKKPTRDDIASDLHRVIYASLADERFSSKNARTFLSHALRDLDTIQSEIEKKRYARVKQTLQKAMDTQRALAKRREDILMASILLRS